RGEHNLTTERASTLITSEDRPEPADQAARCGCSAVRSRTRQDGDHDRLPVGAGAQEFGAGEGARGVPAGGGRHLGEADGRVRAGRDLVLGGGAERIAGGTGGGSGSSRRGDDEVLPSGAEEVPGRLLAGALLESEHGAVDEAGVGSEEGSTAERDYRDNHGDAVPRYDLPS